MPKITLSQSHRSWWRGDEIHILSVLALAALFFYFAGLALRTFKEADRVGKPEVFRDSISIIGKGVIKATPDIAVLSAGLETTAQGVSAAQKENTEKMNGFLGRAKELGIADADRKTTQYTIYPKYEYQEKDGSNTQVKVGNTVMQTVELKVRNAQNLPALMAALGEFGLNQVGSLSFTFDDEETIRKRALAQAINDAQTKAALVARASGITLGKVISFYENDENYPMPYAGGSTEIMKAENENTPAPEPQAGTQEITAQATLTYEVK